MYYDPNIVSAWVYVYVPRICAQEKNKEGSIPNVNSGISGIIYFFS